MIISRPMLAQKLRDGFRVVCTPKLTVFDVGRAIRDTFCEAKKSTARQLVWLFARKVKRLQMSARLTHTNCKRIFKAWYSEASYHCTMPSYGMAFKDFRGCLEKVKYADGVCLQNLERKAFGEGSERLESLVHIIGRYHQGKQFALSSDALAGVLGVHQTTVSRWIRQLVASGVLVVVEQADFRKCNAKEYRLKSLENQPFSSDACHAVVSESSLQAEEEKTGLEGVALTTDLALVAFLREIVECDSDNRWLAEAQLREMVVVIDADL